MSENEIATQIVDSAYKIHTALGLGLLESAYDAVIEYELKGRGLTVETQVPVPVVYGAVRLDKGFFADVIVEGKVLIELKSVEKVVPVHLKQLQTYLKLTKLRLGLLINFNVALIKDGITRVANGMPT